MVQNQISRRTFIGAAGAAALAAGLAGCSSSSSSSAASTSASASAASASAASASAEASSAAAESASAEAASSEAAPAADAPAAAAKPVILVISFGTSFNDSRNITIGAIENSIREVFADYDVRRAFTAQIIIDKLAERDGIVIDNVTEALERCVADGVQELVVQPTHLMHGFEYDDVVAELANYEDKIASIKVAEPLLSSDDDFERVIDAIYAATAPYQADDTAIIFMGHGTEHESNEVYGKLQEKIDARGIERFIITTVEAEPSFEDAVNAVKEAELPKAVLRPLMVVAGDHANNDMADADDPESLAGMLEAEGVQVTSVIEGLGQLRAIDEIYIDHVKAALA